jgi:hypothetical protein
MKPVWPNIQHSRLLRRLFRGVSFALATFFLTTGLMTPVVGALHPAQQSGDLTAPATVETLLAQDPNTSDNATLYFNTPTFAVSVHPRNSQNLQMNVYDTQNNRSEQLNVPTVFRGSLNNDGWVSYDSLGSRNGRNVIYRASANPNAFQARLEILDASNQQVLLSQNSTSIRAMNVPRPETGPSAPNLANTIVSFETSNYAVRVFNDSGVRKLNVYNKSSRQQVVNGQPASLESPGTPPFECWVNYFGGNQFNGAAARYFVRVSGRNEARLEVIDANGSVLLDEPRTSGSPLVTNIPSSDIPQCFGGSGSGTTPSSLAPFIAAVFGDQNTLQQVQQFLTSFNRNPGGFTCSVDPRFESARQGQFINAAECDNRNDAAVVVELLRGRGFNSRLVYRNFRYR